MPRTHFSLIGLGLLASCSLPHTIDSLEQNNPPPEFGRPGWVRGSAGVGAWIGGFAGAVVSIVVLPVTYPISLLAGDSLGGETSRQEFLLFPMTGGAAFGHFLFGAPPDLIDHVFRRAWLESPPPANTYELMPMEPPLTPSPAAPLLPEERGALEPPKEAPKEKPKETPRAPETPR